MAIHYRDEEAIYIKASHDRVTVIFSTIFREETDRVFGKVFLQVRIFPIFSIGEEREISLTVERFRSSSTRAAERSRTLRKCYTATSRRWNSRACEACRTAATEKSAT